jgi:hypothetical protein
LGAEQELANLVGEAAHREQMAVRRPLGRILVLEQFAHPRELLGGGQHLRRLGVAERREAVLEDAVREAVDREDLQARQRRREPTQQPGPRAVARAPGTHHEDDPFRVVHGLDQHGEALEQRSGLAGTGAARDEQRPGAVLEYPRLAGVGGEGGRHVTDGSPG